MRDDLDWEIRDISVDVSFILNAEGEVGKSSRESVLGRGKGMCKGPEAEDFWDARPNEYEYLCIEWTLQI